MLVLPIASEIHKRFTEAAQQKKMIFIAGLLGTGKSLMIQQLAQIAAEQGRRIHLLQYDVARSSFETPTILEQYPETTAGVTAAEIRLAVDAWARQAVAEWLANHPDAEDLLIGELPLIGRRLLSLSEVQDDALEPHLVAAEESIFFVPVPSWEVREVIENKRAASLEEPQNALEQADASPQVMAALWQEVNTVARDINLTKANAETPYNPYIYGGVYERILKNRPNAALVVNDILEPVASVYEHKVQRHYLRADEAAIARYIQQVAMLEASEVQKQVNSWHHQLVDEAEPVERGPELVLPLPKILHEQTIANTLGQELSSTQRHALQEFMRLPIDTAPSKVLPALEEALRHFQDDNLPTVLTETKKHDIYDSYFHVRRVQGDDAQSFIYGLLFSYRNAIANLSNVEDGVSIIEMPMLRVALDTTLKHFIA